VALRAARRAGHDPDAMTLAGHIAELRRRLLIAVGAVLVAAVAGFVLYAHLLAFLQHPYCTAFPHSCKFYATSPLTGLSLRFKIATFGGLIIASPVILWELWRFITPGLKHKERRYAVSFVLASVALFLLGCSLAYFSFEHALIFLRNIGGPSLKPIYDPNQYLSLMLLVMFLYGITFIFPVLLVSLELAEVVSSAALLKHWRIAVMVITMAAALFTPTGDPLSMLLLMIPLIIFYFAAIFVGRLLRK
jgi:sec-independent protein translocase protein TatC